MSLQGKVALVTGASRGIGQAIALELGRLGAVVIGTRPARPAPRRSPKPSRPMASRVRAWSWTFPATNP